MARQNQIGFGAIYESPLTPDVEIETENKSVEQAVLKIMNFIKPKLDFRTHRHTYTTTEMSC